MAQAAQHSSTFLNPRDIALRYGLEACSFSHPTGSQSVGARNQKCWALICGAQKRPNPTSLAAVKWLKRQVLERQVLPFEPADAQRSRESGVLPSTRPEREALAATKPRWPGANEP